jgi:hypothetical protein
MRAARLFLVLGMLAVLAVPSGIAQQNIPTPEADAAFTAKEWKQAAQLYGAAVERDPANGRAWFRLGRARFEMKDLRGAIEAWKKSEASGLPPAFSQYNLAVGYAALGEVDLALDYLDKVAATAFIPVQQVLGDEDFAPLRGHPRFQKAVQEMRKRAEPCRHDPRYRAFDFWIGSWDVFDPAKNQVGTSRVELILDDCVLLENWQATFGGGGKSFNIYSPADDGWRQYWVAANGTVTEYRGKVVDGAIRLEGESLSPNGTRRLQRMTFSKLDGGGVRQLIETTTDGGKTWQPAFDGTYVPGKATPPGVVGAP